MIEGHEETKMLDDELYDATTSQSNHELKIQYLSLLLNYCKQETGYLETALEVVEEANVVIKRKLKEMVDEPS